MQNKHTKHARNNSDALLLVNIVEESPNKEEDANDTGAAGQG